MSATEQIIRRSELINRRAIDRRTVEDVGHVEQLWLDPQSYQVVGFTCKSGLLGKKKRWLTWAQIDTIGENILVNVNQDSPETEQPEHLVLAIGSEVLTDAGNKAGVLVDYLFDTKTGEILSYLFQSSGWRGVLDGIYVLPATAISSRGSKRAIVAEAAVLAAQQYVEGIGQRVGHARELLQRDIREVWDDAPSVRQGAQNLAKNVEGVKQNAQKLAAGFQDKAQAVKEQAEAKLAQLRGLRSEGTSPATPEVPAETKEPSVPKEPEI